ncbi:MAG: TldD/PmbA family protein [Candidatus Cryptobacteroides sp.]
MPALERFAIPKNQLQSLTSKALSSGGSWCDLYFENTSIWSLVLRDSIVSSGGYHRDYGCGIRVLNGEKTGYAYTESTDMESLSKAAKAAGSIADTSGVATFPQKGVKIEGAPNYYPMVQDLREAQTSDFVPLLQDLDRKVRQADSRVTNVLAMLSYSLSEIMMYNSLDELTEDLRPLCSLALTVVFRQGDDIQTKNCSKSLRMGAEFYSEALIEEICSQVSRGVDSLFEASRPKGGVMNVVMAAGASGILLHEAMGHAFEADFNRKGQSIFADKLGKRICKAGLNIVDDATLPFFRGSTNYDDEGVPGQKTYMVRDGVLTSFLHDRISASYYGVAPTGNGRRESFRYYPIPRMRSTYMENGQDGTLEDLIYRAGNGIYVDEFSNGEVKIGEGDFTFYVKSGYMIENGHLTRPIKDVNIIGNGPQALADIEAVASDLKIDEGKWTCGKGQNMPVSCGIPSVLIKNLTVGGSAI